MTGCLFTDPPLPGPASGLVPPAGHVVRWLRERDGGQPLCYAPFRALPPAVAAAAVEALGVGLGDLFVDFGSGDGSVVAAAAARGADAVGIEIDPDLVARSRAALACRFPDLVRTRRVRVLHEPIGWRPATGMTVGFVNLLPFAGRYLVGGLLEAAGPGVRIGTVNEGLFGRSLVDEALPLPGGLTLYVRRASGPLAGAAPIRPPGPPIVA